MRAAILLLTLAALVIASAWNAAALCDAMAAMYAYEPLRQLLTWTLGLTGAGLGIAALVLISRRAYRQVERDFPHTWNDN